MGYGPGSGEGLGVGVGVGVGVATGCVGVVLTGAGVVTGVAVTGVLVTGAGWLTGAGLAVEVGRWTGLLLWTPLGSLPAWWPDEVGAVPLLSCVGVDDVPVETVE